MSEQTPNHLLLRTGRQHPTDASFIAARRITERYGPHLGSTDVPRKATVYPAMVEGSMITLYGFGRVHRMVIGETRDLRAQWALEETGLPYRVHGLDHTGGELDGPAYSRIGCFHLVPVIDDEGFIVAESGAVVLYLAEKAGKLIPADFKGRMRVVQWCF